MIFARCRPPSLGHSYLFIRNGIHNPNRLHRILSTSSRRHHDGRTYTEALELLTGLQSNRAITSSISNSSTSMNALAIPEMISWTRKAGYEVEDFVKAGLSCIHVAGTKGKGSVCAMVEGILRQYQNQGDRDMGRIGVYTSPHLISVRERIRIDGNPISEELFAKYFFELWDRFSAQSNSNSMETRPGYFRYLTIMAFHTFMSEGVTNAVIECGIGGEYDSTNILPANAVSVTAITKLGIDHVGMLGDSIEQIAWHKAGIMKNGVPAFSVVQSPEAEAVLTQRAAERGAAFAVQERMALLDTGRVKLGLEGEFQKDNASLAISVAASHLQNLGILSLNLDVENQLPKQFRDGLETVSWPGRCQTYEDGKITWLIDGAHTHESLEAAASWYCRKLIEAGWMQHNGSEKLVKTMLVFNQQDRDASALLKTLLANLKHEPDVNRPVLDQAVFCSNNPYKQDGDPDGQEAPVDTSVQKVLAGTFWSQDKTTACFVFGSIEEAVKHARSTALDLHENQKLMVFVTGSLYLVGGLLQVLEDTDS
ncbi:hypothetical protein BP6252_03646 [Coleophoma cylindrospora]|uniref:Folylpolyglutamate synthase n=1 Tax=Coleophoma cylindrospora TaxID=1849047 RepID=A0A3D8S8V5_9HELO|nr:hypothetical protein BP6252_03646 [Coleophoma cylindrospora]